MSASIATDPSDPPRSGPPDDLLPEASDDAPVGRLEALLQAVHPALVGLALFGLALVVYVASNPERADRYDHFVWQAHAFLQGRSEIAYPVTEGPYRNDHFQDVLPLPGTGLGRIPFPPLPAIILLPFVALNGLGTNGAAVAAVLGAVNVALCWIVLLRVTPRRSAALVGTLFYGFGTVAWYAAMLGTTWFLAHVAASTFLFLSIWAALSAEGPLRTLRAGPSAAEVRHERRLAAAIRDQLAAGILLGTAGLARLTTVFGAPFYLFVGGAGWLRRAVAAGIGAALPVALLVAYNLVTTGAVLHPAYEHLYEVEHRPRPELVNPDWRIEDPRYIPQNAVIMLAWLPERPLLDEPACRADPPAGAGLLLDPRCPLLRPDPLGMSILLVSPAYLLAIPVLLRFWRRRLVAGAGLAVLAIAILDLMHFSQGWVQFGYRFSNDFAPFAVILVTLGLARVGLGWLSLSLVGLSILVNAWGVYWGVTLGW